MAVMDETKKYALKLACSFGVEGTSADTVAAARLYEAYLREQPVTGDVSPSTAQPDTGETFIVGRAYRRTGLSAPLTYLVHYVHGTRAVASYTRDDYLYSATLLAEDRPKYVEV